MTDDVREWRVTFGTQYAREPHPYLAEAHPDGWATVWAVDERQARAITHAHLVGAWAFIYALGDQTANDWERQFPRGELAVLNPEMAP